MEMEGGDNDFAKAVLAGLDKCEELGYEDVELWSDSQRACGVLSDFETINMDDRNRMECMLLRFKSTRFKRLVSVQKPREIKDWSLCEILFMVDDILIEKVHSRYLLRNLLKKWSPYLRGQSIYSITRTKLTRYIIRTKLTRDIIRKFGMSCSQNMFYLFFCIVFGLKLFGTLFYRLRHPIGAVPLHEAAERFSVDMIKLLFRQGASANVRTIGDEVTADLLPLHVAVEKYLHAYISMWRTIYPVSAGLYLRAHSSAMPT
uniref:Uncharacterized protein n=1 Tax=Oryza rufipogon TaxID=4529 RepID=A0A0E0PHY4_ORYRU